MSPRGNGVPINKEASAVEEIVSIDLFGRQFQFRTDKPLEDCEKVVEKLKQYVSQAEEQTHNTASVQNRVVVLLLAGMNLANDLVATESEALKFHDRVDRKSSDLLNKLSVFVSNNG